MYELKIAVRITKSGKWDDISSRHVEMSIALDDMTKLPVGGVVEALIRGAAQEVADIEAEAEKPLTVAEIVD